MLVPLSWLKDYVPLPANPADLIERLTLAGLESSGVRVVGLPTPAGVQVKPEDATPVWERDKVIVALVTKIEKHPDADKLKLVTCDTGSGSKTVVTGAPNIAPGQSGMKVILGLQGTKYYYTDKDGTKKVFTLEPKALRGIMNDAMCMSNYELGIAEDHDGIIILDDNDPAPGTPAVDLLGDVIVELDVLPNMARCLGLLGIAREVAALTGASVCTPKVTLKDQPGIANIAIADANLSRRYVGFEISNVTVKPAPRWMRSRLQAAGMRPINNLVDVTNYVMLETSQPLHAFDLDVLKARAASTPLPSREGPGEGPEAASEKSGVRSVAGAGPSPNPSLEGRGVSIVVRPAIDGEVLKTLDGVERKLTPENLVIADAVGPIALAGVMGGLETEVTEKTKNVLLEAAHFDFVSVRRTARQFNLFSEASTRFSRGLHPDSAMAAGVRAAQLIVETSGADAGVGIVDHYAAPLTLPTIELNRSEIERLLGTPMPDGEVERVLTALDFKLEATMWGWNVTPPSNRLDIQTGAADLIEDLARVSGYDRLPSRLISPEMPPPLGNRELELEEKVQDVLAALGLDECITYSLVGETPGAAVELKNPVSPERSRLRTSLVPGLLEVAKRHIEATGQARIYEVGPVFLVGHVSNVPSPNGTMESCPTLPLEPRRIGIVLAGGADFALLKGIVAALLNELHVPDVSYSHAGSEWLHPAQRAAVHSGGTFLGDFGALHPRGGFDGAFVAGLDLDAILRVIPTRVGYMPFSTFPPAKRDVAVVVSAETTAAAVMTEIRAAGGELLTSADLFDVYTGDAIPAGTKSLAFALTYQAMDRTLGEKEIAKAHEKVESRLKHVLKAQIRGKDA